MSRHEDSFQIPLPAEKAKALCGQALTSLGLTINQDLGYGFVSSEKFQFGITWPATLNVIVNQGERGMSLIKIGASNFGFGPIQSSHVKEHVRILRMRIEQMLQYPAGAQPRSLTYAQPAPAGPRPASGRQVFFNGAQLRDEEINFLEQRYRTPIPDGSYWYDKMCGALGRQGGPVSCTIEPNLDLGGPLQADASNGNTGVFINGRELHYLDTALLQHVVPMIIQGRWWFDTYGNFGNEGGPMLGNLWVLAQSQSGGGSGSKASVLSSWDRTGVAVF